MEGWPRHLPLEPTGGAWDPSRALDEVRQAIAIERRATTSAHPVRVDAVVPLVPEEGLWELHITTSKPELPLQDWRCGNLRCELADGGPTWSAQVIDIERRGVFLVHGDPEPTEQAPDTCPPHSGEARLFPFDYLHAPRQLLRPAHSALHASYAGLLRAALGLARSPAAATPWAHSWVRVWGPPGTGKTTTLVREVSRLVAAGERVLVLSTTNRATDEAAIRLGRQGTPTLRVGALDVRRYRQAGQLHVLPQPTDQLDLLERAQGDLARAATPRQRARAQRRLAQLRRGTPGLREVVSAPAGPAVVTTLHGALRTLVSDDLEPFHAAGHAPFTTVVLDEAGLVPRATAAAAALLAARRMVLVGDARQLSPICRATRSMSPLVKRWLAVSALEGAQADDPTVQTLTEQHRMHPDIRAAVSALQYEGRLTDALTVRERPWPAGRRLGHSPRAAWVQLEHCGVTPADAAPSRHQRSWRREASLEVLARALAHYPELREVRGLFITPYRAQAEAAEALLPPGWQSSTIHAQQGAEAPVVVFDPVRIDGWPVPEWKRLFNVAISRARELVWVMSTTEELARLPWLGSLRARLTPVQLDGQGALSRRTAQVSLLAPAPEPTRAAPVAAAPPSPRTQRDPASLGSQIQQGRATRQSLTHDQVALLARNLDDLGPRLVRGVAGSGKTVVLARWCASELHRWPEKEAVVLYGNTALKRQLERLLSRSWTLVAGGELPWERLKLVHATTLLRDLVSEAGLPALPEGTWDPDAFAARLAETPLPPRFDLLYIDEAQDLGDAALRLVIRLVRPHGGRRPVRVFYDNAQNIYGRSTPVWARLGLDLRGRSTVLRTSFRATRPCVELALNLLHQLHPLTDDGDLRELMAQDLLLEQDGWWRAHFAAVQGEAPRLPPAALKRADELAEMAAAVRGWLDDEVAPRHIRVLAPTSRLCEQAVAALHAAGVPARFRRNRELDNRTGDVLVTTVHSFKGYEAEVVCVVGLDAFAHPKTGPNAALLYVGLTRARTLMRVSATGCHEAWAGAPIVAALDRARSRLGR